MVFDFIPKFHQESLGQRLMKGYVSLSAHLSYPITHITSFCYFIPESSRSKQENKEITVNVYK